MQLEDLEIYRLSREISQDAWELYDRFDWETRKTMGNQWIGSIDSVGANIAEGFGRFHYQDKNKFNYNARGSLIEAQHWTQLLAERKVIAVDVCTSIVGKCEKLKAKLNSYIRSTKQQLQK